MFEIILKETKDFLRDRSNVFFFLIFPVLLVFLLGNLLSNPDKAEEAIGEVKIHYMVEAENVVDIMTIEGFVSEVSDEQNIFFDKTTDLEASKDNVENGNIASIVVFTGNPLEIQIYEGIDRIKNRTINSIINGFSQVNKAVNVIIKSNPMSIMDSMNSKASNDDLMKQKDLWIQRTMLDYSAISLMYIL